MPAEDDESISEEQRDKIIEQNEEIEKSNELFSKLKQYVKLVTPEEDEDPLPDYSVMDEKCLVRINNYRDPVNPDASVDAAAMNTSTLSKDKHESHTSAVNAGEDAGSKADHESETSSQRAQKHIEAFEIEKLSHRVIMLRAANAEHYEGNLMVQHGEAVYFVRRQILEKARNYWKEAKEINTNYVLGMTERKQKMLDEKFEEHCIKELGYQLGEQYEDQNMRVTFKTFLKADDPRLEE